MLNMVFWGPPVRVYISPFLKGIRPFVFHYYLIETLFADFEGIVCNVKKSIM
jgi:hypothetical protein